MEKVDFQPKTHLFICCRARENKACCSSKGAEEMVAELKKWVKETHRVFDIKVSKSSCLGYCQTGVTACLYPQNQWFHQLSPEDLPTLKKMLTEAAE